jgi:hypothetical protein
MLEFEAYLAGSIAESWSRCLPLWAVAGRVSDFPRGIRFTRYTPSFETLLGRAFVEKFADDYAFLLDRFVQGSVLETACAFDLLDFLAGHLYQTSSPLPHSLRSCALPLPGQVQREVDGDWIYSPYGLDTVGKLLAFEHNGQHPVTGELIPPSLLAKPLP